MYMGVDLTTLSMSSCGVSCVGGIVGSLCATVLGAGAIMLLTQKINL